MGVGHNDYQYQQAQTRSNIRQQEAGPGYGIDGSLKLMNHESFDRLS